MVAGGGLVAGGVLVDVGGFGAGVGLVTSTDKVNEGLRSERSRNIKGCRLTWPPDAVQPV